MKKNPETQEQEQVAKPVAEYVLSYSIGDKLGNMSFGKRRKMALTVREALAHNGFTVKLTLTKDVI